MTCLRVLLISMLLPMAGLVAAQDELPDPDTMSPEAYAAAVHRMCEQWADEAGVDAAERPAYIAECVQDQMED
ncbi:MAG TPA: hypothetical protein VL027_00350 [Spongiibacteraceae bacterium]|jgi:hypothetical protein|nr:hypothetical protein [Spongiibacteraceae bacterium]HUH36372.1 hypothetical protein [Spongiibacteraceae bacterium]